MHCSKPFYIRDLGIHGFWYLQGIREAVPFIYREMTIVIFGESKVNMRIFGCVGVNAIYPHTAQGSTVHIHMYTHVSVCVFIYLVLFSRMG